MVRRTSFRRRKTPMRPAAEFQFGWDSFPGRAMPLSPLPASPSQGDGGRQVLKTHVSEWFQQIWNAKISYWLKKTHCLWPAARAEWGAPPVMNNWLFTMARSSLYSVF